MQGNHHDIIFILCQQAVSPSIAQRTKHTDTLLKKTA